MSASGTLAVRGARTALGSVVDDIVDSQISHGSVAP